MPSGQLGQVMRHLRRLVGKRPVEDLADGQLLEQFVARRDMAAFEALVQRYGPLVLGVCRRVLGDEHDAEDAFQATFLVFARRAGAIRSQGAVGSWLCGTAYRISLKAKAAAARRRAQEKRASTMPKIDPESEAAWHELKPVLDEELNRLPEKYRIPLVLCYLEGKTNEVAARELGWAPGSMSYRLAQARERLRERLVRRGVALSTALIGPALAVHAVVDVPAALVAPTVKGAVLFAAGQTVAGIVTTHAVALAESILQAIHLFKVFLAALIGLFLLVLVGGGFLLLSGKSNDPFTDALALDTRPGLVQPTDPENRIAVQFADNQKFCISILKLKDPLNPEKPKRLMRDERGNTNNTCVRIDGNEYIFGRDGAGAHWLKHKGKVQKEVAVGDRKWVSIMDYEDTKVRVLQSVEIVVGEQTRLYDTALVRYRVENLDNKPHSVGLRAMLDTFIGANDGVPFLIPPTDKAPAYLLETMEVFDKDRVPPFLRALETGDLHDKNATVAEMGLKLKGLEPLDRLVVCRWPEDHGAGDARWEWQYQSMNEPAGKDKDSCVALYWNKVSLKPREQRAVGYTYGLGRTADGTGTDRVPMRLLVGGSSRVGKIFTITAYVKGARAGQKIALTLPGELAFAAGQAAEQIIELQADKEYAQVSWRVQAAKVGKFTVAAAWTGRNASQEVHVRESSIFD